MTRFQVNAPFGRRPEMQGRAGAGGTLSGRTWSYGQLALFLGGTVLAAALTVLLGHRLIRGQYEQARLRTGRDLASIAAFKVSQIVSWREERLRDAILLQTDPGLPGEVFRQIKGGQASPAWAARIQRLLQDFPYEDILVVGQDGRLLQSASGATTGTAEAEIQALGRALREQRPMLTVLYRHEGTRSIHCSVAVPLHDPASVKQAGLILVTRVEAFLFPLIQTWPKPSDSAETLLAERQGDHVLFLNELRHKKGTALSMTIEMTQTQVPVVQALRGREGLFEGIDYRGVPVLSFLSKVAGTPWVIVSKMDAEEALQGPRNQARLVSGMLGAFLLTALCLGLVFLLWWQRLQVAAEAERVRRRGLQDLAETEDRHRQMIEQVTDYAILSLDTQGLVRTWNAGAQKIIGYPAEEILGRHFSAFYPAEGVASGKPQAELAIAADKGRFEEEALRVRKDGTPFWANVVLTALRDGSGALLGFIKVTRDITERHHLRKALELERNKLAAAFENAENGLVISGPQGGDITMNAAALRFHGFHSVEDMHRRLEDYASEWELRQPDGQIIPFEDWPLARAIRGEFVTNLELHYRKLASGLEWDCNLTAKPVLDAAGEVALIVISLLDITKRTQAEKDLLALNEDLERRVAERTRQVEEVSRAKTEFLANMSHELRTPLNSIIGFSEMLKDGLLGDLNPKQRGCLADIFEAGSHLLSLINDILDLSKVEAGAMSLEAQAVDIRALLEASTTMVKGKAQAHGIRIETRIDPTLDTMLADERKVKQIVYNLLSNAIKFTPPGGEILLRGELCTRAGVALDPARPGRLLAMPRDVGDDFLVVKVEDSGSGIAPEDLEKLFEPFTQVDSSIARRHAGTGLGLSLVRRLAELHGGTVGVSSRPGEGSCFSVWLPYHASVVPGPSGLARTSAPEPSSAEAPLALVIEDDDGAADLISVALHREGYQTMRAATAEEGLVRAAKRKPDLITLDIFLPAMDGWEFMNRLNADPRLANTPVVIISVAPDHDRAVALGARRVLVKPLRAPELKEALAGIIDPHPGQEGHRVMVVDDNAKAVEVLGLALETEGFTVLRAYGGAEAIQVAQHARLDLVILDLLMPGVSGFEVARVLRGSAATRGIPIVVVTAKDLSAEDRERLNGDVVGILAKSSLSGGELAAEVRRALPSRGKG